jgi:pyruvate/2-oxoglutarate dehydrogenase complex dihydrolipoamide acyltransferase (E2) component
MAVDFKFPDVGEGIHEGKIVKWLVREGDRVKNDQALVEVETDKAVVELPSPAAGKILKLFHKEGETVNVGESLVTIGAEGERAAAPTPVHEAVAKVVEAIKPPTAPAPEAPKRALASPSTRALARELGVNIELVQGSGPAGRISAEDVRASSSHRVVTREGSPVAIKEERVVLANEAGDQRIPLSGLRKIIADRMSYSKTHIPDAVGMDLVNVTRLVAIREREKAKAEKDGVHLTFLPFIAKAVVIGLKKYPKFNAHFDNEAQELVIKPRYNISIAVDTPDGLMAPVLKDADRKSIVQMAKEIAELADQARTRKIRLEDMQGGTFTITNIGSVGGMFSVPIINPPQVAIMGVHRIRDMPVVVDGKIRIGKVMGISLAFDHRVADGAEATLFMNEIIRHLEDPDLLLLEMV